MGGGYKILHAAQQILQLLSLEASPGASAWATLDFIFLLVKLSCVRNVPLVIPNASSASAQEYPGSEWGWGVQNAFIAVTRPWVGSQRIELGEKSRRE